MFHVFATAAVSIFVHVLAPFLLAFAAVSSIPTTFISGFVTFSLSIWLTFTPSPSPSAIGSFIFSIHPLSSTATFSTSPSISPSLSWPLLFISSIDFLFRPRCSGDPAPD